LTQRAKIERYCFLFLKGSASIWKCLSVRGSTGDNDDPFSGTIDDCVSTIVR